METRLFDSKYLILMFLFLLHLTGSKAQIHHPFLQIPLIEQKYITDGKITDEPWHKAVKLSEFVNWSSDNYIVDTVRVFLFYDKENINIAFFNFDPTAKETSKSAATKGLRDSFLWGRNHNMVSLSYNGVTLQLIGDPGGTMSDSRNGDIKWNGSWQYSASVNNGNWTSEFTIPFSDFGISDIVSGATLNLSLSRSYPRGESASWNGHCKLSSQSSLSCELGNWPTPVPGKNLLSVGARNNGKESADLIYELELIPLVGKPEFINQVDQGPSSELKISSSSEPLYYRSEYKLSPGQELKDSILYQLPVEGSYYASAIVKSVNGDLIRRNSDFWFTIEPNREKLDHLKEKIGESIASMKRISNPVASGLKDNAGQILKNLRSLQESLNSEWNSGDWDKLTSIVTDRTRQVEQHLNKVRWSSLHNWSIPGDFGLSLNNSIIKLRKDAEYPLPITDVISISLARNEYESFHLALLPFGKDLNNLQVELSDLKGVGMNSIPKENIEVSVVDYNKIDWQAEYVTEYKGWHPDPLIPVKNVKRISGDDICRPLWITVYASSDTKPGVYTGTITMIAEGLKPVTAYISCNVRNFSLPVESHLKTHSWDNIQNMAGFYNLEEYPVDWYLKFCDLLLKNRLNPSSAGMNYLRRTPDKNGEFDFSRTEKILEYCIDKGLNRFSMIQMRKGLYSPEESESVYKFIESYSRFLRSHAWLDKSLIELWDEPTSLEMPYIRERAERIKKIDPDLRLELFAEGGPYNFWDTATNKYGLNKLVDIWAPFHIAESPESQAEGREIWSYFCTLARNNAPNFYIDCPAIYQRTISWYCWMYGIDGFEHWGTNSYWRNVRKGSPMEMKWPNVLWDSRSYFYFNGEGQLIYPGPDGIPYSSIRLENFRDGMEDYEYLFQLRELLTKNYKNITETELNEYRRLLKPENYLLIKYPRDIKITLENTIRFPDQPELILEFRNKIADAIERLQKMN